MKEEVRGLKIFPLGNPCERGCSVPFRLRVSDFYSTKQTNKILEGSDLCLEEYTVDQLYIIITVGT